MTHYALLDRRPLLLAALALAGCVAPAGGDELASAFAADEGKADMVRQTRLIDDIGLDTTVEGRFDPRIRVYGYTVEARAGATVRIALTTNGGMSVGERAGQPLDTVIGLYGPFESVTAPGARIAHSDDAADSVSPEALTFTPTVDGRYLIAFSSWEDTGDDSEYDLTVSCEGTDFQCQRPDWDAPCTPGRIFVQGASIAQDTTWEQCEVVLLEPTVVAEGVTLTIRPGVTVLGNFFGGAAPFGTVTLTVNGTLQAAGTAEHPVAFRPFVENHGWGGIVLVGTGHTISHAFIERANVGVALQANAQANLDDVVIEGLTDANGNPQSAAGVRAQVDVTARFVRALVKGFQVGLNLENARNLVVEDSVVRNNNVGVTVTGARPISGCSSPTPAPAVFRDPVFLHTDIFQNLGTGLLINGSDVIVQVERSNIVDNGGFGVEVRGERVHDESFIRSSNIFGNHNTRPDQVIAQVRSFHSQGVLDISGNHWRHISDPGLSASWSFQCNGGSQPTGFAPEPIADAGPRMDRVIPAVQQACLATVQE